MKKLMKLLLLVCFYSAVAVAQNAPTPTDNTVLPNDAAVAKPITSSDHPNHAVAAKPITSSDLTITGAYVQPLIPGQKNTAAYMTINNNTKQTYILTGATSVIAQNVELHTVLMQDGVMKMRSVDVITLLPGQQVVLQPGDFHIMLMNVNTELTKDTLVPICLQFKDSANICQDVPVIDKRTDTHNH
jgi:copper(I)-binding protein